MYLYIELKLYIIYLPLVLIHLYFYFIFKSNIYWRSLSPVFHAMNYWRRFRFSQFPLQTPLLIFTIVQWSVKLTTILKQEGGVNDARIMHHIASPPQQQPFAIRPSIHHTHQWAADWASHHHCQPCASTGTACLSTDERVRFPMGRLRTGRPRRRRNWKWWKLVRDSLNGGLFNP